MGTSVELTRAEGGRPLTGSLAMVPLVVTTTKDPNDADGDAEVVTEGVTAPVGKGTGEAEFC